jgi:hypothetical protein
VSDAGTGQGAGMGGDADRGRRQRLMSGVTAEDIRKRYGSQLPPDLRAKMTTPAPPPPREDRVPRDTSGDSARFQGGFRGGSPFDLYGSIALQSLRCMEEGVRFWGRLAQAWADALPIGMERRPREASEGREPRDRAQPIVQELLSTMRHMSDRDFARLRRELIDALGAIEEPGDSWRRWRAKP